MNIEKTKLFLALSNPIRLRCLYLLVANGEVCVCEVVEALQITQPAASKALNSLKTVGLVSDRRDANWIYYRLRSDLPEWVNAIVSATASEMSLSRECVDDEKRFKHLVARPRDTVCPT